MISYQVNENFVNIPYYRLPGLPKYRMENDGSVTYVKWIRNEALDPNSNNKIKYIFNWTREQVKSDYDSHGTYYLINDSEQEFNDGFGYYDKNQALSWIQRTAKKYQLDFINQLTIGQLKLTTYNSWANRLMGAIQLFWNTYINNSSNSIIRELCDKLRTEMTIIDNKEVPAYDTLTIDIDCEWNPSIRYSFNEMEIIKNNKRGSKSITESPREIDLYPIIKEKKEYIIYGKITYELDGILTYRASQNVRIIWINEED